MPSVQKYFLREVEKMGDLKKFPRKIFLTGCQVSDNGKKVDYKILTLECNKIGERICHGWDKRTPQLVLSLMEQDHQRA